MKDRDLLVYVKLVASTKRAWGGKLTKSSNFKMELWETQTLIITMCAFSALQAVSFTPPQKQGREAYRLHFTDEKTEAEKVRGDTQRWR